MLDTKQSLNIVIPVFNEQKILEQNILTLRDFCVRQLSDYDWYITIADNGSYDNTKIIGQKLAEQANIKYLRSDEAGRGQMLRHAFMHSQDDYYAYMDIDLATDLSSLPLLMQKLAGGEYDLVIGSRFHRASKIQRSALREVVSRSYMFLAKLIVGTSVSDLQCGFKGLNKKIATDIVPLTCDRRWFFDSELVFLAEKKRLKIAEVPVNWVETRNIGRKSKVKLLKSISEFLLNLIRFKIHSKNG